ncbi:hypothetical protein ACWX0K_24055 (plasmid) [Nitrobacteraceae bacterium UC4446_H13]
MAGTVRKITMQDLKTFIDKLRSDAESCSIIAQTASNEPKRKILSALADTYRKLAGEMERIASAHAILEEEREKQLLGIIGGATDTGENLTKIAELLSAAASNK